MTKPTLLQMIEANYLEKIAENADAPLKKDLREQAIQIRRMGRKPMPEHRRRKNPILVRFTDGELEFLKVIAEENERELAEFVHELVMTAAEARFLPENG